MLDVTTTKHTTPASAATSSTTTEVVDIFDDPLNASDVWLSKFQAMQYVYFAVFAVSLLPQILW